MCLLNKIKQSLCVCFTGTGHDSTFPKDTIHHFASVKGA